MCEGKLIGIFIVVLLLQPKFAIGAIAILAFGDPSAVLIGRRMGRHKWNHNPEKSIEGSAAMFAVSAIALTFLLHPLEAIVVSLSATAFESLPLRISDNLVIPIISGMVTVGIAGVV
jgi:phytol kinase